MARWFQRSLGGLLVMLVLLLNLLASSAALHQMLHADADQAQHHCAVTLFAHGQVDSVDIEVAAPVPDVAIEFSPSVPASVSSPGAENFPPGRAPPFASYNS